MDRDCDSCLKTKPDTSSFCDDTFDVSAIEADYSTKSVKFQ